MIPRNDDDSSMKLKIDTPSIELYKILKLQGLTGSGGSAKLVIADGQVLVNGIVETRKRKKIIAGDRIQFAGEQIVVCHADKQTHEC